ncbi:hypothetical protein VitviT2T_030755 [Vitis vinifera]|uniref:Uncharacterized protein n=3 Tax=Vitis vinifera TaxID=29760 RepID=A0ABY9E0L7_VITVI|nr:hypothetical protein VitviT2T_030755 [Vitis vinifera]
MPAVEGETRSTLRLYESGRSLARWLPRSHGGEGLSLWMDPTVEDPEPYQSGGFISHGGWNSILESLWCGVPIMVWPMYAEQKLNACKIVRELGLGVGVTENEDYIDGQDLLMIYTNGGDLVKSEKLEIGVKRLMDGDNEVRRKVKQMSDTFREAVMDGGSSFVVLQQFIDDVFTEIK